jgi:hypothetical protein
VDVFEIFDDESAALRSFGAPVVTEPARRPSVAV